MGWIAMGEREQEKKMGNTQTDGGKDCYILWVNFEVEKEAQTVQVQIFIRVYTSTWKYQRLY
jgi:hypothetical protein